MCFVYECIVSSMPCNEPDHPQYRGMWTEGKYVYFFFDSNVDEFFKNWLRNQQNILFSNSYNFHPSRWQKFSASLKIGSFRIKTLHSEDPPSARFPQLEENLTILLKTGPSFGSGVHPTTKASLVAMEKAFRSGRYRTVLDCGTGSGILGIASAMLGAEKIICLDINLLSIRDAKGNVKLNIKDKTFYFIIGDGISCINPSAVDLLVMNIEWPSLNSILRNQKWHSFNTIIMSGFPSFLKNVVIGLTRKTHFIIHSVQHDGWEALILVRRNIR